MPEWVSFWTPKPLESTTLDSQFFVRNFNLKRITEFFHLNIIPMTLNKDIMPYFDKCIRKCIPYVMVEILVFFGPLKIWTPKDFIIANLGHPVSESWLRPCSEITTGAIYDQPKELTS